LLCALAANKEIVIISAAGLDAADGTNVCAA
jgi:hypothetical protein